MWLALKDRSDILRQDEIVAKTVTPEDAVRTTPLVLAISDGHRTDALLCMAILTRARYEQQFGTYAKLENGETKFTDTNYVFSPEYFGVFSDNEFTVRAYQDGVVVDGKHIIMDHEHPIFAGKPVEQWDETHKRQNAPERYTEGKEIFNRRNPSFAVP